MAAPIQLMPHGYGSSLPFQPDLDPVPAVAARDQEIRPRAEPVVAPGLPLPQGPAVHGRNARQVAEVFVQKQPVMGYAVWLRLSPSLRGVAHPVARLAPENSAFMTSALPHQFQ